MISRAASWLDCCQLDTNYSQKGRGTSFKKMLLSKTLPSRHVCGAFNINTNIVNLQSRDKPRKDMAPLDRWNKETGWGSHEMLVNKQDSAMASESNPTSPFLPWAPVPTSLGMQSGLGVIRGSKPSLSEATLGYLITALESLSHTGKWDPWN